MEMLMYIVGVVNEYLWLLLIPVLIGVGLYFTVKGRGLQFLKLKEMFGVLTRRENERVVDKAGISSFGAFCVSLASRVGTGNLAGVASALAIGGPGSIFWMWLVAVVGSASAFVESTLAQLYKEKSVDGTFVGGPAYYIKKGLGSKWLAVAFAVVITFTYGFFFNSVQSNTVSLAICSAFEVENFVVGLVFALLTLVVIFGGIKRIAKVSSIVVPIMAVAYILLVFVVLVLNYTMIWDVIEEIFASAFGLRQVGSGMVGAAISQGVRRGLFSNEAGMGSAPNAAATADVTHPVKQGFVQALGVFSDTLIICTCTALMILISDVPLSAEGLKGIELTQQALDIHIDGWGGVMVAIFIVFFAFTSIIGNYYYGESNIAFITKKKVYLQIYRLMVVGMVFWGAMMSLDLAWSLADIFMAIMTLINLYAIAMLSPKAFAAYKDYIGQKRIGKDSPVYNNGEFEEWK